MCVCAVIILVFVSFCLFWLIGSQKVLIFKTDLHLCFIESFQAFRLSTPNPAWAHKICAKFRYFDIAHLFWLSVYFCVREQINWIWKISVGIPPDSPVVACFMFHTDFVVDLYLCFVLPQATASADGVIRIYEAVDVMNLANWSLQHEFNSRISCSCLTWNSSRCVQVDVMEEGPSHNWGCFWLHAIPSKTATSLHKASFCYWDCEYIVLREQSWWGLKCQQLKELSASGIRVRFLFSTVSFLSFSHFSASL